MGQLRTQVYIDERKILDESYKRDDGTELDEYDVDPRTSHFVVLDGAGEVLATSRLIYRDAGETPLLPAESLFSLDIAAHPGREVSRLITDRSRLAPELRRMSHLLKLYLIRAMTQESVARAGAGPLYAVIEKPLLAELRRIGIAIDVVGDPIFIERYNSENLLVQFRYMDVTRQMHEADRARVAGHSGRRELLAAFMEKEKDRLGEGPIDVRSDFRTPTREQYERNLGWLSRAEHERLAEALVSVAGAGGDGGAVAVQLARLGVRRFRLADPDPFEVENLNRQEGASFRTIGRNKAEVVAELISDIQPLAEIEIYPDGVVEDNVSAFVAGSDLVLDETEFTRHEIGVMIAREARRQGVPGVVALNVGFGSYVTSFDPKRGMTFEEYLGLDPEASLEEITTAQVPISRWVPHIPSYADMRIFGRIAAGEVSAPSVAPGVGIAASHAAHVALAHLLEDVSPAWGRHVRLAPRGRAVDLVDGVREVRFPRLHFALSAAVAYARTALHLNSLMDY